MTNATLGTQTSHQQQLLGVGQSGAREPFMRAPGRAFDLQLGGGHEAKQAAPHGTPAATVGCKVARGEARVNAAADVPRGTGAAPVHARQGAR